MEDQSKRRCVGEIYNTKELEKSHRGNFFISFLKHTYLNIKRNMCEIILCVGDS